MVIMHAPKITKQATPQVLPDLPQITFMGRRICSTPGAIAFGLPCAVYLVGGYDSPQGQARTRSNSLYTWIQVVVDRCAS